MIRWYEAEISELENINRERFHTTTQWNTITLGNQTIEFIIQMPEITYVLILWKVDKPYILLAIALL